MIYSVRKISEKGSAAIFSVVSVGIFAMIMATNIMFLSLDDLDMANTYKSKADLQIVLNSCMDDVLRRVQMDNSYQETLRTIFYVNGNCNYSLVKTGITYELLASVVVGNYTKQVELNFQFQNGILVNSMVEVFE